MHSSNGLKPDLTIYLDVDPKLGLIRSRGTAKEGSGKGELDRMEQERLDFHQRVRAAFHDIAKREPNRVHIIDSRKSRSIVFNQALELLKR
jgi:dTMP kinase